ncbi:MAG: alanine racemase [Patescibacteria group bacterium]|nr:alanine racemase [Patescibacteria group bacterium]
MNLIKSIRRFKKSRDSYQPLIEVSISRGDILHNLRQFQAAFAGLKFAPVLKSNAYGHGLVEVANILDNQGLPFFVIDSLFEARVLHRAGVGTPLLIIGYATIDNINSQKLQKTAFTITSFEQLKQINDKLNRPAVFHLKIDTGMRRQGLLPGELPKAAAIIKNNRLIKLEGLCSHFADADGESDDFSQKQIETWQEAVKTIQALLGQIKYRHLSNSAGADLVNQTDVNVGRLGIGLYGFNLSPRRRLDLRPALEMKSVISSLRPLKPSEPIGYGGSFTALRNMVAATVPVGYTEGLDRRLSSIGALMTSGKPCPILGRVSMNMCSIDVSSVPHPRLEQPVIIISKNPKDPNSLEHMSELCHTIPYELLVHLPTQLKRTVVT